MSSPATAGATGATTPVTGWTALVPLVAAVAIFSENRAVAGITNDALIAVAMINFFIF